MSNEESNTVLNTNLTSSNTQSNPVKDNWIKIVDGKFECGECGYINVPETNTSDGVVEANIDEIKERLISNPKSDISIYGICPTCAMEYTFRLVNNELYLEPSDMMK